MKLVPFMKSVAVTWVMSGGALLGSVELAAQWVVAIICPFS